MKSKGELNQKQICFINEYLVDLNATQAAIRAGYSRKSARQIGGLLLTRPHIKIALKAAQNDLARRTQVTQEMVIAELKKIAFSNISDFIEWGPEGITLKPSVLDTDQSASIANISTRPADGKLIKIRLHNKERALGLLVKYLGFNVQPSDYEIAPILTSDDDTGEKIKDDSPTPVPPISPPKTD